MTSNSITSAFSEAATQLGFGFKPGFALKLPNGGVIGTLGLVVNFGSNLGTLLFAESSRPSKIEQDQIKDAGYYYSLLFPHYSKFDERLFEDTLNDWGYFGSEVQRPEWYTGKSWDL
ncbi:MAG: hypothetical protein HY255_06035 [Betaproteobacteria bacterium]|nr:hypothetical protein [Betaproteobacteria bacterium]